MCALLGSCVCGCVLAVVSVCVSLLWRVVFFVLQVFGSILDCAGFFPIPLMCWPMLAFIGLRFVELRQKT